MFLKKEISVSAYLLQGHRFIDLLLVHINPIKILGQPNALVYHVIFAVVELCSYCYIVLVDSITFFSATQTRTQYHRVIPLKFVFPLRLSP